MHAVDLKCGRKITGRVKWSQEYKNFVYLVELWLLLNNRYEEHHYNSRKITQLQRKFPHVPSDINEVAIITGLRSTYSGKKITKNQAEDLSIK